MSRKYKVDMAKVVYDSLTCGSRSCHNCEDALSESCRGTKSKIFEELCIPVLKQGTIYDDNALPPAGLEVCAIANGKKIMAHVLYDEDGLPLAWQNCANPDDLYMLNEVTKWALVFIGEVEIELELD